MKAELIGGQHDGKVVDVPEPLPPELILPDLADYAGTPDFSKEGMGPDEAYSPLRTLTYVRQLRQPGKYLKKVVYVYEP